MWLKCLTKVLSIWERGSCHYSQSDTYRPIYQPYWWQEILTYTWPTQAKNKKQLKHLLFMLVTNFVWGSSKKKKRDVVENRAFTDQQSHLRVLLLQMCVSNQAVFLLTTELCMPLLLHLHSQSLHVLLCEQRKKGLQQLNVYLLFRTHLLAFMPPWHVTQCVKGETGYFCGTLSIPLCSQGIHLSITQNPMSGLCWLLGRGHRLL